MRGGTGAAVRRLQRTAVLQRQPGQWARAPQGRALQGGGERTHGVSLGTPRLRGIQLDAADTLVARGYQVADHA